MNYHYMNIAQLLDMVFHIYKKTFVSQLLRVFIIGTISAVIGVAAAFGISAFIIGAYMSDFDFDSLSGSAVFIVIGLCVIFLLVIALVSSVNSAAGISLCSQAFCGHKPDINLMIKQAFKNTISVFTANVFVFILFIPIIAASFGFIYFFGFDYGYPVLPVLSVIIPAGVITAACMLLLSSITCLSMASAFFEGFKFHRAFMRSFALIKGSWPKAAAALLLWQIINLVIRYSVTVVFALPAALTTSLGGYGMMTTLMTVTSYGSSIITTLIMAPFADIMTTLIYYNQRIKKEGMDIILSLENEV